METPGDPDDGGLRPDVLSSALEALDDVRMSELAPARWAQVEETLEALAAAIATGDNDAAENAVAILDLIGPMRKTRIGTAPIVPAPPPVRERVLSLVHHLSELTAIRRDGGGDERTAAR